MENPYLLWQTISVPYIVALTSWAVVGSLTVRNWPAGHVLGTDHDKIAEEIITIWQLLSP